jgi:hypothetical protein
VLTPLKFLTPKIFQLKEFQVKYILFKNILK